MSSDSINDAEGKLVSYIYTNNRHNDVFITLALNIGFAYRYVHFQGDENSQEINQGFPYIFAEYIKQVVQSEEAASISVAVFRDAICISMISKPEQTWENIATLFSTVFNTKKSEELFRLSKQETIRVIENAYTNSTVKANLHITEFSDKNKGFEFDKTARDIQELDYETFCTYLNDFIYPGNALLLAVGPIDKDSGISQLDGLAQSFKRRNTRGFTVCAETFDPVLQGDEHKTLLGSEAFRLCCMRFHFGNSEISLAERYLLLKVISGNIIGAQSRVSVDAFDASIVYHGKDRPPEKEKLRLTLSDEGFVSSSKQRILSQADFDINNHPSTCYQEWGSLLLRNIDPLGLLHLVKSISVNELLDLFDRADLIVSEGIVNVKNYREEMEARQNVK
jgi:hypothetical protein